MLGKGIKDIEGLWSAVDRFLGVLRTILDILAAADVCIRQCDVIG